MSFITDDELFQAVADRLKQSSPAVMPSWWRGVIEEANAGAYQTILGGLLARGFDQGQVDAWDRGREFQKAHGLWLALTNGGALDAINPETLAALNREKELCTVQVFAGGVWQRPQDPQQQGTVGFGKQVDGESIFSLDMQW